VEIHVPDMEAIRTFNPTVVINTAFPTRDRVVALGLGKYLETAQSLTGRLLAYAQLPVVSGVVTFSSGAAVPSEKFPADLHRNPYGVLKAREEQALLELAAVGNFNAQVCRVWAVSGPHVQNPQGYAIADFIGQAQRTGWIDVRSKCPVIRSYASVDDVVALTVARLRTGSGLFDSHGADVEIGELAHTVVGVLGGAGVRRPRFDPDAAADDYRGPSVQWERSCRSLGYHPATLVEQLKAMSQGLAARWLP
jgi:nucleoside-diphosphate-sugar epimerase